MTVYNWLVLLGVPALVTGLFAYIRTLFSSVKALKLGTQALLRDRLLQEYLTHSTAGYASPDDRLNYLNLYQQYHSLGANGVMDDIKERFMSLPLYKEVSNNET